MFKGASRPFSVAQDGTDGQTHRHDNAPGSRHRSGNMNDPNVE